MDKIDTKDLTKAITNLCTVIRDQNKQIERQNQYIKENTETLKDLKTRLGSVANAITNGGNIVNV